MTTASATPTRDDINAWYETQRAINPDAAAQGLTVDTHTDKTTADVADDTPESLKILDAIGTALDVPEHLVVNGFHITVGSPTLDDVINVYKSLQAEAGSLEKLSKQADDMSGSDFTTLLKTVPAVRSMFLRAIHVRRENGLDEPFNDEDEKWKWFSSEIDVIAVADIVEMFIERTDWERLITRVRRIMGKLQGLAVRVKTA